MSSLLELIARRRRASAGRRLGPPPSGYGPPPPLARPAPLNGSANGHPTNGHATNGHAPVSVAEPEIAMPVENEWPALVWPPVAEPVAEPEPEPEPELEVVPEPEAEPEPEVAPEPEAEVEPDPEPAAALPAYESWLPTASLLDFPEPAHAPAPEPEPEPEPEPAEPVAAATAVPTEPGFLERGRMRRRARYLRQLRELQLRDIGGFAVELRRYGREQPTLVETKIDSATETDEELRALERALDGRVPLRELREPGIGGACATCGAVHGTHDRFCSACGASLTA